MHIDVLAVIRYNMIIWRILDENISNFKVSA